ncbi:MAG: glycosyltransferase family 4 protein [Chthoniobacterales bacterium]
MKVAFVVQRCGAEVNGGAEALCLQVAHRMRQHWDVEILTTCALDYVRWENHYPAGEEVVGSVTIRRFEVDEPRDTKAFDALSGRLVAKGRAATLQEQEDWMRAQGPVSTKLLEHLQARKDTYDAFLFFGYLYATTYFGLPLVKEKALLAPLGHDEWPIHLSMWDDLFAAARGYVFQTLEELEFLRTRFPQLALGGPVAGIGVDMPERLEPEKFRTAYQLGSPFVLFFGRIDASKGCDQMFEWFMSRETRREAPLKLVVIGREVLPVPFHDNIIYPGFVSEEEKWNALAACDWMLLPSKYESLSISLLETWATGRPAIVNAQSEVLRGHCRRANGGLWFETWAECEAIIRSVGAPMQRILGAQGREYVRSHYSWARVEAEYLRALEPFTKGRKAS